MLITNSFIVNFNMPNSFESNQQVPNFEHAMTTKELYRLFKLAATLCINDRHSHHLDQSNFSQPQDNVQSRISEIDNSTILANPALPTQYQTDNDTDRFSNRSNPYDTDLYT
jgi:hypothetical protein